MIGRIVVQVQACSSPGVPIRKHLEPIANGSALSAPIASLSAKAS